MLRLVSLNVERSRHLDRIFPFIEKELPDVLSLQEVLERDLADFQRVSGLAHVIWLRDTFIDHPTNTGGQPDYSGIAILSRHPFVSRESAYYYMPEAGISLEAKEMVDARATNAQGVVWGSIEKEGKIFTIVNTHFTWTADGYPNDLQEADFHALESILSKIEPHILTGDLNAPRGRGMWENFRALYAVDAIPEGTESTIDPALHKNTSLRLVVDALFSASDYDVQNVRIVPGLSDHKAVIAEIFRSQE